jgi:hypothetical protein
MAQHKDDPGRSAGPLARGTLDFIRFRDFDTLSLRQVDELNGVRKGTAFRHFKALRDALVEERDYFYLDAGAHAGFIGQLRREGRIYASTRHVVLLTESGYRQLSGARNPDR